jgi:hypothetical protein
MSNKLSGIVAYICGCYFSYLLTIKASQPHGFLFYWSIAMIVVNFMSIILIAHKGED